MCVHLEWSRVLNLWSWSALLPAMELFTHLLRMNEYRYNEYSLYLSRLCNVVLRSPAPATSTYIRCFKMCYFEMEWALSLRGVIVLNLVPSLPAMHEAYVLYWKRVGVGWSPALLWQSTKGRPSVNQSVWTPIQDLTDLTACLVHPSVTSPEHASALLSALGPSPKPPFLTTR